MANIPVSVSGVGETLPYEELLQETSDDSNDTMSPQTSQPSGSSQAQSFLSREAMAQYGGQQKYCSYLYGQRLERSFKAIRLQLHFLIVKADEIQACVLRENESLNKALLNEVVKEFIKSCHPIFNRLEFTARSTSSQHLPMEVCTKMLVFASQLCDRLERLLLFCNAYNVVSLDESDPESLSYFYVGCCQVGQLRFKSFRYCRLTPYLAQKNTRIYKRMRWNVDRLQDNYKIEDSWTAVEHMETVGETDYYFLCYEEAVILQSHEGSAPDVLGIWSIGQWVQTHPDSNTDNVLNWLLYEVPEGLYNRLLVLGKVEPSTCSATDYLHRLLTQQSGNFRASPEEETVSAVA